MASIAKNLSVMQQVRRINKELDGVADKCRDEISQTVAIQAALVASEIRSVAPVDPDSATPGALKASVRVEEGTPTSKKQVLFRILAGGISTIKQGAGKAYNWARAVEFGTVDMPAHPFFFPIWRARRKDVRAAIRKAVKNAVSRVFK